MNATTPSNSLRIDNVSFGSPFTLAALSGYSDRAMRTISRRCGASLTRCEVVLDDIVLAGGKGARRAFDLADDDHPCVGQLMGSVPDTFAKAATELASAGFDVIDINFGCPVNKVLGRCRGGYLLSEPESALEIVAKVRDAVQVPLTIKMRRATDQSDQADQNFWEILDGAVRLGINGVAVHGRTVQQKYVGPADWRCIAKVKVAYPQLVVFGSGDLFTAENCLRMLAETGCDGVTIARGAIGNPWIFRRCDALWKGTPPPAWPTVGEQGRLIRDHYMMAMEIYGQQRGSRMMRKFGIRYAALHPQPQEVKLAFIEVKNRNELLLVLRQWYGPPYENQRPQEPAAFNAARTG